MLTGGKADPYREARTRRSSAVRDMLRWAVGTDRGGVRGDRERQQWRGRSVSQLGSIPGRQASQPVEGEER